MCRTRNARDQVTMEELSMKRSIGKKLLAGIVSLSMILGVPVAGYSQEDAQTETALILLEDAAPAEEVLAGAGTVEETVPEEEAAEITVAEDITEEEPAQADVIAAPAEEEPAEELPDDGIILEPEQEEDLALAAAEDETPAAVTVEVKDEDELRTAIQHASENSVIKLTKDISCGSAVSLMDVSHMMKDTNTLTIDLAGFKLTVPWFVVGTGKTLNLDNGDFIGTLSVGGGTVNLPKGITLSGDECVDIYEGGTVNLNGGSIVSSDTGSALFAVLIRKGTLNISGDSTIRTTATDRGGLLLEDKDAVVNMTGGNILTEQDTANYAVAIDAGTMKMSGGRITSEKGRGIGVSSLTAAAVGSFSITKGIITTLDNTMELKDKGQISVAGEKGAKGQAEATTQLISSTGYAIADAIGSDYDSSISVTGGYLSGAILPIYSDNPQYSKETDRKIIVKVATDAVGFNKNMNDWREYLSSINCRTKRNSSNVYEIYTLTADTAAAGYIRNNLIYYTESVQEAMDKFDKPYSPKNGDTVRICRDIKDEEKISVSEIDRIIDLYGHTLKTKLVIEKAQVTIRNSGSAGKLEAYTNDSALVLEDGADVTLEKSLTIASPGSSAVTVGGDSADTCKLTVNGTITALYSPIDVLAGNNEVNITSAKLSADSGEVGTGLYIHSTATGAKVTVKDSTITGGYGISAYEGELTISGSTVTGEAEPTGTQDDPGTTAVGAALDIADAKLTITSGTFTSKYAHAMVLDAPAAGSKVSGGTFKSSQEKGKWDAVDGTPASAMFTGGTYYPNKVNDMGAGVDTASYALAGAEDGTFYVLAYDKVMAQIYSANASATSFVIGAGAAGKLIKGCKVHTKFTNLSGADLDLLIGTDDTVAKNKIKLPKDAEELVIHNDLEALTTTGNATPTCTLPSVNKDCWYCTTLKKFYKDSYGKEEADDTYFKEAATGHKWSAYDASGWRTCTVCGEKEQQPYQISGFPKKLKLKVSGKKLTVSWKAPTKAQLKKIKGVYIEVATDSAFTNIVKTKKVKKAKTSFTFKLQKKTRYYVRVRFYNGAKISKWSPVRNKKTKG